MSKHTRDKSNKLPGAFQLIRPGYEAFGVNMFLYIVVMLLPVLLTLPLSISSTGSDQASGAYLYKDILTISDMALFVISFLTLPALTYLQLKSARGEKVMPKETLHITRAYIARLVLMQLLIMVMVFLGLLLFIIPGLIVLRRYFLASYYLLDDDCSIRQALSRSRKDSESYSKSIWGVLGLGILLGISAAIPVIGLVAMFLLFSYVFMPALRYHQIRADQGWTFDQKAIPPKHKP